MDFKELKVKDKRLSEIGSLIIVLLVIAASNNADNNITVSANTYLA